MATRKKTKFLSFSFDSPLVIIFAVISIFIMVLNSIAESRSASGLLGFFSAPTSFRVAETAFNFRNPVHYLRLFFHIFGQRKWINLVRDLSFILLLGPQLEKLYGTKMLLLMFSVCAFTSGVLGICFLQQPLCGASCIAFMMILLTVYMSIKKQVVPVSSVLLLLLYIGQGISNAGGGNTEIIHLIGGICGSLFGMIQPEKKPAAAPKKQPQNIDTDSV
ncbi:MAG: rhomboid family intramembrane serine protease [Spirochaetaceae bacterium]|nr:rhomboid family intramembrane serine protease [Spirochaetaceae bacterium]